MPSSAVRVEATRKSFASRVAATEVETASRTALDRRYRLLPYLYTLFQESSRTGLPVMRPLFLADPADPVWDANLVPSSPVRELPTAGDLAEIVALAKQQRPEVRQVVDERRVADLDMVYAKNQALPQADVVVQYFSNGFAGILQQVLNFEYIRCNLPPHGLTCPTPPPPTGSTALRQSRCVRG